MLKGLYLITDSVLTPDNTILEQVEIALKNGVKIFQFRDKKRTDREVYQIARQLKELIIDKYNAIFLIDDRVELAYQLDASGVHIGKDDIGVKEARKIIGNEKIIGVSCYGNVNYAEKMQNEGADYVAFGSFFSSPTKPNSNVIKKEVLAEAKNRLKVPICAIGGITAENSDELSNADMVSVISDVWSNKYNNIEKRIQDYKNWI
jgi:thiamine-phosphate pyrophosphorylase